MILTQEELATNARTYKHILEVQKLLAKIQVDLGRRALNHDQSKLVPPEVSMFTEYTPKLAAMTYGSAEYKQCLKEMSVALEHHYANNRHHPEHYPDGITDMNLLDILEMLCDWLAATKRTDNGDIQRSLKLNQDRFGIDQQLLRIMKNTVEILEQKE